MDIGAASSAKAVTLHDTNIVAANRGFYVGVAGDVKFTTIDGDTLTLPFPQGFVPIQVKVLWSTGTTATTLAVVN